MVWIIGASSGIGAYLAADFAASGAQTVLSARRVDMLENLSKEIQTKHPSAPIPLVLPLDATNFDAHEPAFQQVLEKYGKIDHLVLNAGAGQEKEALTTSFSDTQRILNLNFLSLVGITKVVLPTMVKQHSGHISVISSIAGLIGLPLMSSYCASKHALNGYFNALRSEISQMHNIDVTVVAPGPVESEIYDKLLRDDYERGSKPLPAMMPTQRCSDLILNGLYRKYSELWIAQQPILVNYYIGQYTPGFSRWLMKTLVGPVEVKAAQEATLRAAGTQA